MFLFSSLSYSTLSSFPFYTFSLLPLLFFHFVPIFLHPRDEEGSPVCTPTLHLSLESPDVALFASNVVRVSQHQSQRQFHSQIPEKKGIDRE